MSCTSPDLYRQWEALLHKYVREAVAVEKSGFKKFRRGYRSGRCCSQFYEIVARDRDELHECYTPATVKKVSSESRGSSTCLQDIDYRPAEFIDLEDSLARYRMSRAMESKTMRATLESLGINKKSTKQWKRESKRENE